MQNDRLITIGKPYVNRVEGKARLFADIDKNGKKQTVWFEVPVEYEKYLTYELSDAFLCAALRYSLQYKFDIKCEAPVTDELLYNLEVHFIPALVKGVPAWHHVKILAETTSERLETLGAVGTGMSCGIDALYSAITHSSSSTKDKASQSSKGPQLTHLMLGAISAFTTMDRVFRDRNLTETEIEKEKKKVQKDISSRANKVAKELGVPLLEVDTNVSNVFGFGYYVHYTAFAVMCLKKFWGTYLLGSGYGYNDFNIAEGSSARYEFLCLAMYSTRELRFISSGAGVNRVEKTSIIADNNTASKHLHCCWREGENCGKCGKCCRTMLTLYLLGKLDNFKKILPVSYFHRQFDHYLKWLGSAVAKKDLFALEVYGLAQKSEHVERVDEWVKYYKIYNAKKGNAK